MITLGARLYFGLTAIAVLSAWVLGLSTGGSILGVLTFSWSGPVGDQLGFTVLAGLAVASFFLGAVTTAFRDADADAVIEVAGTDELPVVAPPAALSPWPLVAAVGATLLLIGLVVDKMLAGVGVFLLAASAIEWTVMAWADRVTGDHDDNRAIRHRLMAPIETPAAAAFGIFMFVFFGSRVLLSISKWGAVGVFSVAAISILVVATLIATRPNISRTVITGALLVGALVLVGGGIAGLAAGEREFHQLGDSGHATAGHSTSDDSTAGETEG